MVKTMDITHATALERLKDREYALRMVMEASSVALIDSTIKIHSATSKFKILPKKLLQAMENTAHHSIRQTILIRIANLGKG